MLVVGVADASLFGKLQTPVCTRLVTHCSICDVFWQW